MYHSQLNSTLESPGELKSFLMMKSHAKSFKSECLDMGSAAANFLTSSEIVK